MSRHRPGGVVRENFEAFAVAIAMALVIRHFCVEAFRIPTGSMMPTLYGDQKHLRKHGDRILVDKIVYLRRDPRRFEVPVFQFPLNRNRNFIKRFAGLPGEWVRIVDGDLWISQNQGESWFLPRKPPGVRDQLFIPYYPEPPPEERDFDPRRAWKADEAWRVGEDAGEFEVSAGVGPATLEFARNVPPYGMSGRSIAVGDVRVSFVFAPASEGALEVRLRDRGVEHALRLSASGSSVRAGGGDGTARPLDFAFEAGETYDVSFANVDDRLVVCVDGDETEIPFPDMPDRPPPADGPFEFDGGDGGRVRPNAIRIVSEGLSAKLTDVRVDRDIHYLGELGDGDGSYIWKVPADSYFMLGDNSAESQDSRRWQIVRATLRGGEVIEWSPGHEDGVRNPGTERPDASRTVTVEQDVGGLTRRFSGADVVEWEIVPAPYVPRDHLVGRAFAVFWPLHIFGLYENETRIKLIR